LVLSTFLVTTTDDAGAGSLRQAILDANATPGSNEIDFAIGEGGVQTIRPATNLPAITNPVVLDGTTQPGFAGIPLIELNGGGVTSEPVGLRVTAGNSTVRGLVINRFTSDFSGRGTGIVLAGSGNVVQGNYIGTDVTGTHDLANDIGVFVSGSDNTIGGTTAGARNLIAGNRGNPDLDLTTGVSVSGSGNLVQGNYIGTDVTGVQALGNDVGVFISGSNNLVGGTTAEARNLISGNGTDGVGIGGNGNLVQGNYIGTDPTGTVALGNGYGVSLGGSDNTIGGTTAGAGNLVSGNAQHGVSIGFGHGNRIEGNYIGTDWTGTAPLGNTTGVSVSGPNLVGGTAAEDRNLISGNRGDGVVISFGSGTQVEGNYIGTDMTGTAPLANGGNGVLIAFAATDNTVGGTSAGAGNLISGNQRNGISIGQPPGSGSDVTGNLMQGNRIGTDVNGTNPLGNGLNGVLVVSARAHGNTVGGEAPGAGNTIAFNGGDGVLVDTGTGNAILGNVVFANGYLGIELVHGGNHDQAAPVLTSATTDGTSTTITGTLTSTPNTTFTLEFVADDASGTGQRFLGSVQVTTDADGNASFTVTFAVALDPGTMVTATATDSANDTSQFSDAVQVTA
jgi:hypothetical protein